MSLPTERRERAIDPSLPATAQAPPTEVVGGVCEARTAYRQHAAACARGWNAVHARIGSFADEHSTL